MSTNLVDPTRMQMLFGNYAAGKSFALSDAAMVLKAQDYRRGLSARMKAMDKVSAKKELPACDYFASRKIDGEFNLLLIDGNQCYSINPGGTVRTGLPFMAEAVELLSKTPHKQMLVAGELFFARNDRRPRVHDVSRVARQPQSQAEIDQLQFAVFDIIEIDGKPAPATYADVFKKI